MTSANPIEEIWQTYQVMEDAVKVASRGIHNEALDMLRGTWFMGKLPEEAKYDLETCRSAAADYAIDKHSDLLDEITPAGAR